MTPTPAAGTGYMLDNAWHDARRRLRLLEDVLDPGTTRRMSAVDGLGVGPGWHCAELGAGGGSIARWLCAQVGPQGRVVALDLDTRFVDGSDLSNLEVRQVDVVSSGLERGVFDLIHARALLMHLPARAEVLGTLIAALRPGGRLLIEEMDFYPIFALAAGTYREAYEALLDAFTAGGGATDWGRELPSLLDTHALQGVDSETTVHAFRGGSATAQFIQVSFEQVRGPILARGRVREEVLDTAVEELGHPDRWFPGFALVAAWGRRRA
jgi:SAM-dependent methyltransferase